jgi:hypothetical protein
LDNAGHINAEAGFGRLPQAQMLAEAMVQSIGRERRLDRAHPLERSFGI